MTATNDSLFRRSSRLDVSDLDFDAFADDPLDEESLRCLRYMHDVEHHTICYLRDVVVTRAHADPEITAFLSCWVYEELWHGDAIGQVLAAHGEAGGSQRVAPLRTNLPKRDKLRPLAFNLASAATRHIVAVQMAWGAVNEWTTQAAYGRLAARAKHPVLTEMLKRIMKQEGRHIDFYARQARSRLDASSRARKLTRYALSHFWGPVGSGVMPDEEVSFMAQFLFSDEDGTQAAARVDQQIDRLPGLAGLDLLVGSARAS
jgi:hypothetical protein